jgi:hypothetical protein
MCLYYLVLRDSVVQIPYNLWAIKLFMKFKMELEIFANHGGRSLN